MLITRPDDPSFDDYRNLNDTTLRRRVEVDRGFFLVEGWQAVGRLLASDWPVRSVLVAAGKEHRIPPGSAPLHVAPPEVITAVVGFDLHRGVIASVERRPDPGPAAVMGGAHTLGVLEGVTDAENLGAIFRSASALGVDGILLDPVSGDPFYRRSVRVSMGAVLLVPWSRLRPWPEALEQVRKAGFRILAMTPHPAATDIAAVEPGGRTAILLGSESRGLSRAARARADGEVRIPQRGVLDSLNVGHAAAIAFHRLAPPGPAGG
ncbi:MAG TPA: RNA methyltransferase [Acidimicrobiia bacterium]|nr:RNA methyltransferase [Acidimicrobiia bacterium]